MECTRTVHERTCVANERTFLLLHVLVSDEDNANLSGRPLSWRRHRQGRIADLQPLTAASRKEFLDYEHSVIIPTRFAGHLNGGRWK